MASSISSIRYPKLEEIKKLIRFVTDEEVSEFECHVPPDKELDDEEFPTCEFDMPSDIKMKSEWGEWVLPLMTALEEDGDLDMSKALWKEYCKIPSQKKREYRLRMCSIVRRERREKLYKKYMFAIGSSLGKKAEADEQPKKPLKYKYVKKAIRSVSDNDDTMLGFECDIPTDDQLDQEGFPNVPDFSMPSDNDLCNEWSKWQPVFRDLLGDSFGDDQSSWANYMMFPQDDRANHRANMYAHMKRRNRKNLYKKWMYVKWRKDKNKDERMVVVEEEVPKEEVVAHDISEVARVVADISEEEVKHDQEEYDHPDNHRSDVDSEEMSKEEIENNLVGENKREGINNIASMGQRPTIFLFIQHDCPDMSHSLYMIQPPLDLSDYDQMIDSEGYMVNADSKHISPVATFQKNDHFLRNSGSVNLGSKIYFFGGLHEQVEGSYSDRVQVFDTDHPEEGMRYVASMNSPKESPCVFAADGMIYALGSPLDNQEKPTSLFERYNPSSNHWEVLPDPPPPLSLWKNTIHLDCATVLGRCVFIADLGAMFNLDTLSWDPSPPPKMVACLPYGSLFVNDSVYHLCGPGTRKPGTACFPIPRVNFGDPVKVVKRGPVTTTKEGDYVSSFLKSLHLASGKELVMAAGLDLNEGIFFTDDNYFPWIDLFHMGCRFFCYIVTAQLVRWDFSEHGEQKSRGVWIRFFEEVPTHTGNCNGNNCNCNETKFRQLASFCYKIVTNFRNPSFFIRCSVLGSVPDSWVNTPLKFKQEWKPKLRNPHNWKTRDDNLKTLLAVKEDENRRLAAELAKKNEILKAYEALLAKTGGMVDV